LNGDWQIDLSGENTFASSTWKYERKAFKTEILTTRGPITEDLTIEVFKVLLVKYVFKWKCQVQQAR